MTAVETQIERVTLYRNGALVQRAGRALAGLVEVQQLPLLLSWPTFRVRPAVGAVHEVSETAHVEFEDGPSTTGETEPRTAIELGIAHTKAQLQSTQTMLEALTTLRPHSAKTDQDQDRTLPNATQWAAIPEWVEQESIRLTKARLELESRLKEQERERLRVFQSAQRVVMPARAFRGAKFTLDGAPEVETRFTVEYFISAARWVPTYALDLEGDAGELTLFAMVANATGEVWDGARLSFSTVDLARETTLPEVLSWRIGRAQDARRPAFRPLPPGLDELFAGYDRGHERAVDSPPPPRSVGGPAGSSGPPPPPAAAPMPVAGAMDKLMPSFEPEESYADEFEDDGDYDDLETTSEVMLQMDSPMQSAAMPPPAMSRSRSSFGGGGSPKMKKAGRRAPAEDVIGGAVSEPLPPSLRTLSMRLRGPEGYPRGTLVPLDDRSHVLDLVDAGDAQVLERAFSALDRSAQGLWHTALPHGTTALGEATPPVLFSGETPTTVPDDGEYHRVAVKQLKTKGEAELRVVPRVSDDVFRFFLFDLEDGVVLPDGPMDVTEDGTFRVRSQVTTTGSVRRLELNLGVEPAVRILGRIARVHQEEKGLMSSASIVEHTVELTLRSTLPTGCTLRIYDRLPVADINEKDVEVTMVNCEPKCTVSDKAPDGEPCRGGIEWRLLLASGETAKVEHAYQIKLPAKTELVGGNRRE